MTTSLTPAVRNLVPEDFDAAEGFVRAVDAYPLPIWNKTAVKEYFPLDALVFAEHQTPWTHFDTYVKDRCHYDDETNDWLVRYVWEMAYAGDKLPPILLHVTDTGIALVDGCHRTSALLMFGVRYFIEAWVVR